MSIFCSDSTIDLAAMENSTSMTFDSVTLRGTSLLKNNFDNLNNSLSFVFVGVVFGDGRLTLSLFKPLLRICTTAYVL